MVAVLLGGATALLPIYAKEVFGTGPWGLGLLRSAPALGALTTALYLARHPLQRHAGRTMFIAVAIFGVATVGFGLSRWLPLSLLFLVTLGAADMVSVVVRSSLIQLSTPDHMRGRVGAVNAMFIGTSNQLGEFESGVTAAWFGAVASVVLVASAHCSPSRLRFARFRNWRRSTAWTRLPAGWEPGVSPLVVRHRCCHGRASECQPRLEPGRRPMAVPRRPGRSRCSGRPARIHVWGTRCRRTTPAGLRALGCATATALYSSRTRGIRAMFLAVAAAGCRGTAQRAGVGAAHVGPIAELGCSWPRVRCSARHSVRHCPIRHVVARPVGPLGPGMRIREPRGREHEGAKCKRAFRSRVDLLHERHHGQAQGCHAEPSGMDDDFGLRAPLLAVR
jgi:MFS family permease